MASICFHKLPVGISFGIGLLASSLLGQSSPGGPVQFNRDVRPILSDKCFTCHGPDPANRKTKLRFDIESGASGVIVPGDPAKSKLYLRISSDNKATRMPPAYAGHDKLPQGDIELIRKWIEQGAK